MDTRSRAALIAESAESAPMEHTNYCCLWCNFKRFNQLNNFKTE